MPRPVPTCASLPCAQICKALCYIWDVIFIPLMLHLGRGISLRSMPRPVPTCASLPCAAPGILAAKAAKICKTDFASDTFF